MYTLSPNPCKNRQAKEHYDPKGTARTALWDTRLPAHHKLVFRLWPIPPLFSMLPFCVFTLEFHRRVSLWPCVGAHVCVQHPGVSWYNGNMNYIVSSSWNGGIGRVSSLRGFAE